MTVSAPSQLSPDTWHDPVAHIFDALEARGYRTRRGIGRAQCPAHNGQHFNLSVRPLKSGQAGVYCHSHQCDYHDIMAALGLDNSPHVAEGVDFDDWSWTPQAYEKTFNPDLGTIHPYYDEHRNLQYQVIRRQPKGFSLRRPNGTGGWIHNLDGVEPLPYLLPWLVESNDLVIICEGEKDTDRLHDLGFTATCNHGGAGKWKHDHAVWLADRDVVVIADNDKPGGKHAQQVADSLVDIARSIKMIEAMPSVPEKGDVSDWFESGGTVEEFRTLLALAPVWRPEPEPPAPTAPSPPVLAPEALSGLAGDVVRAFDPFTEADPAAVLATFLVSFGNAAGPSSHTYVGERRHGVNLAAVICGATSRSRKGTSAAPVERIMKEADKQWLAERRTDGIGSGEGIIWAVRDATEPKTDAKTSKSIVEDTGVTDKRLMVHEEEFSGFLKVTGRDGSIASEIFRKGWDAQDVLRNLVKRAPVKATGAHLSFLGHITLAELRRTLTETDQANGVGNRVLWVHAQRSKLLPDSPRVDNSIVTGLAERTRQALDFARRGWELKRDYEAAESWRIIYEELTTDHPGLFGALTSRAEAQVLRLSMIYALLDCSQVVRREHLVAGIAVWEYCQESARYIFGDSTGDSIADRIRQALQGGEMTETEIRDLFGRNQRHQALQSALRYLEVEGYAQCHLRKTSRRPARVWRLTA